jgi:hypothetical protein
MAICGRIQLIHLAHLILPGMAGDMHQAVPVGDDLDILRWPAR